MPKPENIELISRFESAIINLNDSTWEYPFRTFLWQVNDKGAFSIEKLFNFMVISEEYHPYKYGENYNHIIKMSKKDFLLKIEQVPEYLLAEILDFVQSIKSKHLQEKIETTILSESSLAKDWLKPEEDEAWQDL